MAELITQSAYAKLRGVTHGAVQKAIASGRLVKCLRKNDKGRVLIDVAVADTEWASNTDKVKQDATKKAAPAAAPASAKSEAPSAPNPAILDGDANVNELDFQEVRTLKEYYLAQSARLDFEERNGKLIDADESRKTAFNAARRARDMLLSIADRLAPVVAGLTETFDCHNAISIEVKRICAELSTGPGNDE